MKEQGQGEEHNNKCILSSKAGLGNRSSLVTEHMPKKTLLTLIERSRKNGAKWLCETLSLY